MNKNSFHFIGQRTRNRNLSKKGSAFRQAKRARLTMTAYCGLAAASLLLIGSPTRHAVAGTITWTDSTNSHLWSDSGNWNPSGPPSGDDVVIGSPASSSTPSQVNQSFSINSLTVDSDSELDVNAGNNLVVANSITDNGTIKLNSTAANSGTGLGISGVVTLTGAGNLILNAFPTATGTANVYDAGSSNLTQDVHHTIEGTGQINVNSFTNNGTVDANSSGNTLLLDSNSSTYTNNNLMEATSGGILEESNTTINQGTSGLIEAAGGNVLLNGGTISGGTLTSLSGSEIDEQNNTALAGVTVSGGTNLYVLDGNNLVLNSTTLTNNGTITVNKGGANIGTGIAIGGAVELAGTGSIVLNANGTALVDANFHDGGSSNLTQDAGHTIEGTGQINVNSFTNNGIVNANSSGNTLLLATNGSAYTNNNLMEATSGGILEESNTTINQGTSGLIKAAGGTVLLNGGTISGGTLTSAIGSEIDEQGSTNLIDTTTSSGSNLFVVAGQNLSLNNGSSNDLITNNGTITVNKGGSSTGTGIAIGGAVELAGTGSIVLNANGTALVDANFHDGGSSNLTQDAGHTIEGTGQINVNIFTNNGIVNANSSGNTLLLATNNGSTYTNNNLMEATSGGILEESNTTINQGPNGLIEANGGNVLLNGGTISGGTLTSLSGSEIDEQNNTALAGVTVSGGTNLYVLDGNNLFLNSTTLTNNGTITVNKGGSSTGTGIAIGGAVELAGTGSIVLNANSASVGDANFHDGGNSNLTQDLGHTISGTGEINVNAFTNNGIVNANSSGNTLLLVSNSSTYTNNNLMEATGKGILEEINTTINQGTNGLIEASGGTVLLNGGTISGGTLTSASGSEIDEQNNTAVAGVTVSGGTNLYVLDGNNLFLNSTTLTNNGTITVNKGGSSTGTGIAIFNAVELAGTGSIVLNANSASVGDANFHDGGSSNLTQDAGHTIEGTGQINVNSFTNNGIVNANSSGNTLLLVSNSSTYTNNNLMEATGKGILEEINTTINQGPNGLIEANGGNVLLNGGTISGGTLTSLSGGEIDEQNNTALAGVTVSGGTNLYVLDGNNLFLNSTTLTNNGTITVNKGGSNTGTGIGIVGTVELAGTGSIVLNANSASVGDANFHDGGSSNLTQDAGHTIEGTGQINVNSFTNNGTVNANVNSDTLALISNSSTYTNNGTFEASNGGTLDASSSNLSNYSASNTTLTGGTYEVTANSTMILPGNVTTNNADIILSGTNTTFAAITPLNNNEGSFHLLNGATFTTAGALTNSGTIETAAALSTLTVTGAFTQTAGLTMDNGIINNSSTMELQGGTLAGTGILSGAVDNTGGTISPGDAPGTLTVGSLNQGSDGSLDILLASLSSFDQLNVTGSASIAGTLDVTLANGFNAPNGSQFDILTSSGLSGIFDKVVLPSDFTISYTGTDVILNYTNNSPAAAPSPASFTLAAAGLLGIAGLGLLRRFRLVSFGTR